MIWWELWGTAFVLTSIVPRISWALGPRQDQPFILPRGAQALLWAETALGFLMAVWGVGL